MADTPKFTKTYENKYEIDTSGGTETPVWAEFAEGISSIQPNLDDKTDDTVYYKDKGFGGIDVTGGTLSIQIQGNRVVGDAAQDYIAGIQFDFDKRKTQFRWTNTSGKVITGEVTVSGITADGGDADAKNTFECTVTYNGKPTVKDASTTGA